MLESDRRSGNVDCADGLHSRIDPLRWRCRTMTRLRFFQNLRTALMLLVAALVIALGAGLWWANQTCLPETWRAMIEG